MFILEFADFLPSRLPLPLALTNLSAAGSTVSFTVLLAALGKCSINIYKMKLGMSEWVRPTLDFLTFTVTLPCHVGLVLGTAAAQGYRVRHSLAF